MRILSDFDGVWTDPTREREAVHATLARELAAATGWSAAETGRLLAEFEAGVMKAPERYGWRTDPERLASFVDEDCFCMPSAIGQYIDESQEPAPLYARTAVLLRWPSLSAFLDHCYHSTGDAFREQVRHDLVPGAEEVLRELLARGMEVVWASNAPAGKIVDWFGEHGFEVVDARESEPGSAPLRVYGRAGKQWMGSGKETLRCGDREIPVDRPQYRAILERECPDLVLGDVLSLDLALPLAMRNAGEEAAPRLVALVERPGLPAWVRAAVGPARDQVDHLIGDLSELMRLPLSAPV